MIFFLVHQSYYVFFFFFISFSVRFAEDQFVGIFWLSIFFVGISKKPEKRFDVMGLTVTRGPMLGTSIIFDKVLVHFF